MGKRVGGLTVKWGGTIFFYKIAPGSAEKSPEIKKTSARGGHLKGKEEKAAN